MTGDLGARTGEVHDKAEEVVDFWFVEDHAAIFARFGRFPGRNAA